MDAFNRCKEISAQRKFNESFEVIIKLNVDPTQGDQNIRGTCMLPAGTGKDVKVCVFADKEFNDKLVEAKADIIGDDHILKQIAEGTIEFDKIIATPDHMPSLKSMARILGPKGLMPNVKSGTLVKADELIEAVKQSKQGLVEYRVTENAFVMNKFGKRDFTDEDLERNLDALLSSIAKKRPETVKGRYFKKA